jgi:hypothetical protein
MDESHAQAVVASRCGACDSEIDPNDNFCRHCGVALGPKLSPSVRIHERLEAIEKRVRRTLIGVILLLLLVSWVLLQTYHFGRGGILG